MASVDRPDCSKPTTADPPLPRRAAVKETMLALEWTETGCTGREVDEERWWTWEMSASMGTRSVEIKKAGQRRVDA